MRNLIEKIRAWWVERNRPESLFFKVYFQNDYSAFSNFALARA
jgi:hypothetical protein